MNEFQKDLYEYLGEIYCEALNNMNCSSDQIEIEFYSGQACMIQIIMERYGFIDSDDWIRMGNERYNIRQMVKARWMSMTNKIPLERSDTNEN